jgi:phenylalanyl-tRNA synthetase beta chain
MIWSENRAELEGGERMRVSYQWLKEYVLIDISPEELAERLTLAGIEVEAVEPFRPPLPGVVSGVIESIEPHPRADNLVVVKVNSDLDTVSVVCGARNIQAGKKVPLALPGAVLPGRGRLEAAEIRGVVSGGMLCSAAELGLELAGAEEGILLLPPETEPGKAVDELLGFNDRILTLSLTPNRADCLGMLGVAYEVAALTGGRILFPPVDPPEIDDDISEAARVTVQDPDLCPRYTARVIQEISIDYSPLWLQLRLLKAGIRPINNIVDITNYVMWEFGQPLHAFDYRLVKDGHIIVRRAETGERFTTLDGVERELQPNILVIADSEKAIALGGVMGGENTEISWNTTEVLLEAALFNPVNIRRTARMLNLTSEASQRFERGVDPEGVIYAQNRAALLMNRLAGGQVLRGVIDVYPEPHRPRQITVRPHRINEIIGDKIPVEQVESILTRLGFTVEPAPLRSLLVTVPLRRGDVSIEEDIVEEVARLYGYGQIPVTLPRGELVESREAPRSQLLERVRDTLVACGFFEVITYSFISPSAMKMLLLDDDDPRLNSIPLQNPLSEEQSIMRTTLLPGLSQVLKHNFNYQENNQFLFELGAVFLPRSLPMKELPEERLNLCLAATGNMPEPHWAAVSVESDFYLLKGVLETLFKRLRLSGLEYSGSTSPFLHPTRSADIHLYGEDIGFLGQLHPDVSKAYDFRQAVIVAELNLEALLSRASITPRARSLPRYPVSLRDIAVVAPRELTAQELYRCISEAGGELVEQITLFDLYEGEQIPAGKRSLAFAIRYRAPDRTLTDEEVNIVHRRIEQALAARGAAIRS